MATIFDSVLSEPQHDSLTDVVAKNNNYKTSHNLATTLT
jgi:hypothetical protein